MSKRSVLIIVGLLVAVVILAAILDLVTPIGVSGFPRFFTIFDLPPGRAGVRPTEPDFGGRPGWANLPRTARSLAGIAALAGYGLLLRYLAPERLGTLARALIGTPARLARHWLNGLALLLLIAALILLAAISLVAAPLAPLLGFGLGIAFFTGLVAFAMAAGQRLRAQAGATEHSPLADLLTGLSAFILIALIPYLGILALALAGLVGLGAVAATRFGATERWEAGSLDY